MTGSSSRRRYLLDTSTIIWAVAAPEKLSRAANRAILSGPLVISVASYWEATVKAKKGLLAIGDPASWWSRAGKDLGAEVLSIRAGHVAALNKLPDHHKDPFDRMLIAQAVAEELVLVSIDEAMRRYPVKVQW